MEADSEVLASFYSKVPITYLTGLKMNLLFEFVNSTEENDIGKIGNRSIGQGLFFCFLFSIYIVIHLLYKRA